MCLIWFPLLVGHLYVSGLWLDVAPKWIQKRHWTTCSIYDNHSRYKNHHNWQDLHDHSISTRIFTLIMKILISAPKTMRKVAMASIWIC